MKIIQPYVQPPSALYTVSQQLSQIMKKEEGDPMIFLYLAQPSVSAAIATFMAEPAQQEMKGMHTFNTFHFCFIFKSSTERPLTSFTRNRISLITSWHT